MLKFRKKQAEKRFDAEVWEPVLRCSICTGEQTACLREKATGRLEEVMLIRGEKDLEEFRRQYGISGPIAKVY